MVYIQRKEYYSAFKKEEMLSFMTAQINPGGYDTKWNKSEKDRYCMIGCMWDLKQQKREFIDKRDPFWGYQSSGVGTEWRQSKGTNLPFTRQICTRDVKHNMMTGVNTAVGYNACKLLTVNPESSHYKEKNVFLVSLWDPEY